MGDHNERACADCGSFLHHEDDCRAGRRYVLRCARCRAVAVVTLAARGADAVVAERVALAPLLAARGFRSVENVGPMAMPSCCGRAISFKRIEATTTADTCDDLCRKATGATCRCACGGANHGARHEVGKAQ